MVQVQHQQGANESSTAHEINRGTPDKVHRTGQQWVDFGAGGTVTRNDYFLGGCWTERKSAGSE